jgi:hypothetical protein
MKIFKLTGAALDWAVAKCEGVEFTYEDHPAHELICFKYSTDWAQGGPIIERECIDLQYQGGDVDVWAADMFGAECSVYGDTPLIAAMRCYVASKLGDEVEIPEELTA